MLIAAKTTVHKLPSGASSSEPQILKENIAVRRVAEGENLEVIALSNGNLIIIDGD